MYKIKNMAGETISNASYWRDAVTLTGDVEADQTKIYQGEITWGYMGSGNWMNSLTGATRNERWTEPANED